MIDSAECRRQAAMLEAEAPSEVDSSIQITLRSMSHGWTTLAKQLDWLEIKRQK
jgi:hypothetical protein